jgi:hypothetical protein
LSTITSQIKELAKVEGIWDDRYEKYAKNWGAIAIWINPESDFQTEINKFWNSLITGNGYQVKRSFDWSDAALINSQYILDKIIIDSKMLEEKSEEKIDFLLLTYMKPKHRNLILNGKKLYPKPQEIAEEIRKSGYSTYFEKNKSSGIITSDDEIINQLLTP